MVHYFFDRVYLSESDWQMRHISLHECNDMAEVVNIVYKESAVGELKEKSLYRL